MILFFVILNVLYSKQNDLEICAYSTQSEIIFNHKELIYGVCGTLCDDIADEKYTFYNTERIYNRFCINCMCYFERLKIIERKYDSRKEILKENYYFDYDDYKLFMNFVKNYNICEKE